MLLKLRLQQAYFFLQNKLMLYQNNVLSFADMNVQHSFEIYITFRHSEIYSETQVINSCSSFLDTFDCRGKAVRSECGYS